MEKAVVLAALLSMVEGSVNYCGAKMCGRTNAHTFCQYSPGPSLQCSGYMEDHLTDEEKARVLARLNRRRSEAAQGRLMQLPTAGNMLKLRWVEELAREAQVWADQCRPPSNPEQQDACRDLYAISVGQCVASVVGEAPGLRAESMVDMWYLQGMHYRGNVTSVQNNKRKEMDFAQMLWAHTYLVGCARSKFMAEVGRRMRTVTRLVCNMAPRGPAGALWLPAAPASACPPRARPDLQLPGLCSHLTEAGDIYDVSNDMTLEEKIVLNTVLEIERNVSLDYFGSLDEIYLTNMAIATLSHPSSTESYSNSVQKRDIIEPLFSEDKHIDYPEDEKRVIEDTIAKMVREKSTVAKKLSIVGRPKSYNMEDLNDFEDKEEYAKTRPVETTTRKERDSYVEYELHDVPDKLEPDENVDVSENPIPLTSMSITEQNSTENSIKTVTEIGNTTMLSSYVVEDNLTLEVNVTNNALKRILELSKKVEENPADTESAQELQEALERLEKSLAGETPGKLSTAPSASSLLSDTSGRLGSAGPTPAGADLGLSNGNPSELLDRQSAVGDGVRRELRRYPEEAQVASGNELTNEESPSPHEASTTAPSQVVNSSFDKLPFHNMMAKYLPFLKKFEGMGNSAHRTKPLSLFSVMILFIS